MVIRNESLEIKSKQIWIVKKAGKNILMSINWVRLVINGGKKMNQHKNLIIIDFLYLSI